jgi:hypothetical protein
MLKVKPTLTKTIDNLDYYSALFLDITIDSGGVSSGRINESPIVTSPDPKSALRNTLRLAKPHSLVGEVK